jgi:hypothetical protein
MQEYLFSYGTIQQGKVQMEIFGRQLTGIPDRLIGYRLASIEIKDASFQDKSEQKYHVIAICSNDKKDAIEGTVFELSMAELLEADKYEPDEYKRVSTELESGIEAWVYVEAG